MSVTISLYLLLRVASSSIIYRDNVLASYKLNQESGQVVRDVSGNSYHGVNGNSLSAEASDVTWTGRGAYFDGNQELTLGSRLITQSQLILSRSFTLVAWVMPLNYKGFIFGCPPGPTFAYDYAYLYDEINSSSDKYFASKTMVGN